MTINICHPNAKNWLSLNCQKLRKRRCVLMRNFTETVVNLKLKKVATIPWEGQITAIIIRTILLWRAGGDCCQMAL